MSNSWFYGSAGNENGPVSFDELFELARSGVLQPSNSLRNGQNSDWVPADSIVGLFPASEATAVATSDPEEITSLDDLDFQIVSDKAIKPKPTDNSNQIKLPATEPSNTEWFYRSGSIELGPLEFEEIAELAKSGTVGRDDYYREGTEGAWRLGEDVVQLLEYFEPIVEESPATEPTPIVASPRNSSTAPPRQKKRDQRPQKIKEPPPATEVDLKDEVDDDEKPPKPPAAAPKPDRWFCEIDGVEHGPLSFDELEMMAKHNRLSETSRVKLGDDGVWKSAIAALPNAFREIQATQSQPAAVSKFEPPPKPKKSRAPRGPLIDVEKLKEQKYVLLGLLAAAILVPVAIFVLPSLIGSSADEYCKQLEEIYAEHKALRERKAPASAWAPLIERATPLAEEIESKFEKTSDSVEREVLFAGRDFLLNMLKDSQQKPTRNETQFTNHVKGARFLLNNPGKTIDDFNAQGQ